MLLPAGLRWLRPQGAPGLGCPWGNIWDRQGRGHPAALVSPWGHSHGYTRPVTGHEASSFKALQLASCNDVFVPLAWREQAASR